MKRITATVILLCMLIASLHSGAIIATASDNVDDAYDSAVGILTGLEILDSEIGSKPVTSEMTRKDFVILLMRCIGADKVMVPSEEEYFYDVSSTDYGAEYIAWAYEMGITQGVEEGIFGANKPVTIEQGIIMCIRALGYELAVNGSPATVGDYLAVAKRVGLYRNINLFVAAPMTYRDGYVLIYNCMTTDILSSYKMLGGETVYFQDRGTSPMEGYFDMRVVEGVINNTPYGAQSAGEYTEPGTVTIGNQLFEVGDTEAEQYIGYNVTAYYRENDFSNELIWLDTTQTDVVKVLLRDVVEYRPLSLTYTNDVDRVKKYNVASNALTLYNGQVYRVNGVVTMPDNGYVELIENTGDSKYDVVKIVDYSILISGGFNTETEYLSDLRDTTKNKDLSQFEYYRVSDPEGYEYRLEDVPNGVVLQIAYNGDKRFAEIIVVENAVDFTVTAIENSADTGEEPIVYNKEGIPYRVSGAYDKIKGNQPILVGNTYSFMLDTNGDIVASALQSNRLKYGYLKQYKGNYGSFADKCLVRMFTQDGIFEDLEIADKIRIYDGSLERNCTVDTATTVLDNYIFPSIVRYSVDGSGKIKTLELPGTISGSTGFRKTGELTASVASSSWRYRSDSKSFGGKVVINDNTIIFAVPSDMSKEENYYCIDSGGLLTSVVYPSVTGYTSKTLSPIAEAVTMDSDYMQKTKSVVMLIDHVEKTYNTSTDETQVSIVGYVGGNKVSYPLDDSVDAVTDFNFEYSVTLSDGTKEKRTFPYEKGDYVQLQFDYNGAVRVSSILRYYSEALQIVPDESGVNDVYSYPSSGMNLNNRYDAGRAVNVIDGYLQMKNAKDNTLLEATDEYYMISNATVYYVLDKQRNKLTPGTAADLVADGSRIFTHTKYGVLDTVLIIKD